MSLNTVRPLNVLVVGAGMYVCGRGTDGFGTILPALYQARKDNLVREIKIADTSPSIIKKLKEKIDGLNKLFGFSVDIGCFPQDDKKDVNAYKKAIKEGWEPDCAIIAVPDHLHFEISYFLIQHGIHCLVAKPLATTTHEVEKLIKLADRNGIYGAVEFHKRFDRSNLKLQESIITGLIGDPLYFTVDYSQRKNIPQEVFKGWIKHTNVFQYLGIHYLDIIYFATRAIPIRVMAIGQKNYLVSKGLDTYDSIQCIVEWEMPSGYRFSSSILTNWIDPEQTTAMSDQKIKVIGTKGRYEADQKYRGILIVTDEQGVEEPNPDFSAFYLASESKSFFKGYGAESVIQFIKDVSNIISGKLSPSELEVEGRRPTFKEALIPTLILEATNESLCSGGDWVYITN